VIRVSPTDDGVPLNPPQRAAVEHEGGPLVILAGAGTGKTRVLVHRIAHLVKRGADPWQILAVTFTNKAAQEMRARLKGLLGDAADAMEIGTFHATCARLLRRFGSQIGLSRAYSIYDEADQAAVLSAVLREVGVDRQSAPPRALAERLDRARDSGRDPAEPAGYLDDAARLAWPLYRNRLAREDATDFSGLLEGVGRLLEEEPSGSSLRRMFRHVLVDEFQDTSPAQYRIILGMSSVTRNLTVVGDDDQAIYAWRGADPRNLLDFPKDFPDARIVKLEQNYRSTQVILDAANHVIKKNTDRHGKALWTDRQGGDAVEISESVDERGEARFVARAVKALVEAGLPPRDVAVLYRTNQQSRVLDEHLRAAGVPARVVGATSFWDRRDVRDVVAYLRASSSAAQDTATERALGAPPRGVGDGTIQKMRTWAAARGSSLLEAARAGAVGGVPGVGPAPRRGLKSFVELVDGLSRLIAGGAPVTQVVAQVVEKSGIRDKLAQEGSDAARDRLRDLDELAASAADFDREAARPIRRAPAPSGELPGDASFPPADPPAAPVISDPAPNLAEGAPAGAAPAEGVPPVIGFLERIALVAPLDEDAKGGRGESATGRVSLMTIHIAKGLEWPVVFLTGMEEGVFPSLRARRGEEASGGVGDQAEERRLAYVAITRARDLLVASWARTRRVYDEVRAQDPSRFLGDLPLSSISDG